jgi:hypothetical protein
MPPLPASTEEIAGFGEKSASCSRPSVIESAPELSHEPQSRESGDAMWEYQPA